MPRDTDKPRLGHDGVVEIKRSVSVLDAHGEAMGLGARLVRAVDGFDFQGFQVGLYPAGHPFCRCWDRRTAG